MIGKILLENKFGLFQLQLESLGEVKTPGKFCNYFPHLSFETVFPVLKLTQNCYIKMNISFS